MLDLLDTAATSAITLTVAAIVRAPGIPAAVRRHDGAAAGRDRQLSTWVADRDHELRRECEAVRATVTPNGDPNTAVPGMRVMEILAQGAHRESAEAADKAIAQARERAIHEYRDEANRARADVDEIMAAEGWAHHTYRRLRRRPAVPLTAPDRAAPVLAAWRKPSAMSGERLTFPADATARTLEAAVASMPVTGP